MDDVEVEVELGSVQVMSKAVSAGVLWVGLAAPRRGRGRNGQRLAAEVGQCGAG
jgi:hypothetical protein